MTTKEFNLLTVAEVAEACRCDPDTVRRWVRNRKLPAVALPVGGYRIRREDFEKILAANY